MCIWSIELIGYQHIEKGKENPHFGQNSRGCTNTDQSCTGTGSVLFFYFDQRSYFRHNFLISYPI